MCLPLLFSAQESPESSSFLTKPKLMKGLDKSIWSLTLATQADCAKTLFIRTQAETGRERLYELRPVEEETRARTNIPYSTKKQRLEILQGSSHAPG